MAKTCIIYSDIETPLKYAIIDGDYSRFHNVMFNSMFFHKYEDECDAFLFDDEGEFKIKFSEDVKTLESKEWDHIAVIVFLL